MENKKIRDNLGKQYVGASHLKFSSIMKWKEDSEDIKCMHKLTNG